MGDKRVSVRTLPDGSKVHHHPPDDSHPEGKQVLIPGPSALKARLEAQLEDNERRHRQLQQRHVDAIDAKKARQRDRGLAPEKSGF